MVAGNLFEQQKNRAVIRYQQVIALAFRNTISRIKQLAQSANELECPDFMNPQRRMAYLSIPAQLCSLIYCSFDFEAVCASSGLSNPESAASYASLRTEASLTLTVPGAS